MKWKALSKLKERISDRTRTEAEEEPNPQLDGDLAGTSTAAVPSPKHLDDVLTVGEPPGSSSSQTTVAGTTAGLRLWDQAYQKVREDPELSRLLGSFQQSLDSATGVTPDGRSIMPLSRAVSSNTPVLTTSTQSR